MIDRRGAILEQAQARGRLSSLAGAVFDRWGQVWVGSTGDVTDLDAQYRIGSITKTLTAVLVLQARDEGLLDLDDTVVAHLETRFDGPVGYGEATLREVLAHLSGMQSEPNGPWWERNRGSDLAALLAANDGTGRVAGAGEWFHYSNLGYGLLGGVLEQVRGTSWRDQVRHQLLVPLGMTRTSYLPRPYARPGWSVHPFTGVRVAEPLHDTGAMAAAGQLWSTVGDLCTWGQFLVGSRPDVLSDASRAELMAEMSPGYALGLRRGMHASGPLVGHTGSMPGFLAALAVQPDSGLGAVVLANATTGVDPWQLVEDLLEGEAEPEASEPWVPTSHVPAGVAGVPGMWFWGNSAQVVRWHNGRLEMTGLATAGEPDVFELRDGQLIGVAGYHRGETLHVLRDRADVVLRLECATFVYTSTPYGT